MLQRFCNGFRCGIKYWGFIVTDQGDSGKTGLKTAISALHDPSAPVPGEIDGEQLALLPLDRRIAANGLPSPRGRGRPPGAKNKNTEAWRAYLLSRYASPLEGLFQTFSVPIEEICKMLGCTKLDAYKLQLMAMKEAAPYVHQKMPLALDAGDKGLINLFFGALPQSAAQVGQGAENAVIEVLQENEQNQILTVDEIENSNVDGSDVSTQDPESIEENDPLTD